ncbi:hypothetical protein PLESTM_000862300 [Pleodorina starrii]|nr:hypothetical protein PLESTM_000862300 [Pleodorina starrii]
MEADPSNEEGAEGAAPAGSSQPPLRAARAPLPVAPTPGGQLPRAAPDQPATLPAASTGAGTGSGAGGALPRGRASSVSPSRLGPQLALRPILLSTTRTPDGSAHAPTQLLQPVVRIPAAGHVGVFDISRGEPATEAADPRLRSPAGPPPDAAAAAATALATAPAGAAAAGPSATTSQPPQVLRAVRSLRGPTGIPSAMAGPAAAGGGGGAERGWGEGVPGHTPDVPQPRPLAMASAPPAPRLPPAAAGFHSSQDAAARRIAQRAAAGFPHAVAAFGPLQPPPPAPPPPPPPQQQHLLPVPELGLNPAAGFHGGAGPVLRQEPAAEDQQAEGGDQIGGGGGGGGGNLNAAGNEPDALPGEIEVTVAVRVTAGARRGGDIIVRGGYMRGQHTGKFNVGRYQADRDCIQYNGRWLSRSNFEKVGGSKMNKWYRSIRVLPDLEPLGEWLVRHGFELQKGPSRRSSKKPVADSGDEQPMMGGPAAVAAPPPPFPFPPRGPAVAGTAASTPSAQASAEAPGFPEQQLLAHVPVLAVATVRPQPHGLSDPLPDPLLEPLAAGGSGIGVGSPGGSGGAGGTGGGSGAGRAFLQRLMNTLPGSSQRVLLPTTQADLEPSARAAAAGPGPGPPEVAGFAGWGAGSSWDAAAAAAPPPQPLATDTDILASSLPQSGSEMLTLPPGTQGMPMLQRRQVLQPPPDHYLAGPDHAPPLAPLPLPSRLPTRPLTTPPQQILTQRFARPPAQEPHGEGPPSPPPRPPLPAPQHQQREQQQQQGDVEMVDLRPGHDNWGPASAAAGAAAGATTAAAVPEAPLLHPGLSGGVLPHVTRIRRLRTESAGPGEALEWGHRPVWYPGGPEPHEQQPQQPTPEQDSAGGPDQDMEDVGRGQVPPGVQRRAAPILLTPDWRGLPPPERQGASRTSSNCSLAD